MKHQLRLASLVAALGLLFSAAQSHAALVDDWGLTGQIFTNGTLGDWTDNASQSGQTTLTNATATISSSTSSVSNYYTTEHWTEGNNTSPLGPDFPSGGKIYDQEFLSWRVVTVGGSNYLQVLLITSVDPYNGNVYGVSSSYRNGDVFLDVNGNSIYDYALSAGTYSDGLTTANHPGTGLYAISDASDVVDIVGSAQLGYGDDPTIASKDNPFAVSTNATPTGDAVAVDIASVSGDSMPDWAVQWTISLAGGSLYSSLYNSSTDELDFSNLVLHVTETCGNDVISTEASGNNEPNVPEPATLSLLGLGLATCGVIRRRVNKNKTR